MAIEDEFRDIDIDAGASRKVVAVERWQSGERRSRKVGRRRVAEVQ